MKLSSLIYLSLILFCACSNSNDLKIAVEDSKEIFKFSAHYDKKNTEKVQRMINAAISPTHIVSTEDWDLTTILDDDTKFKIESAPGDLLIEFNKKENSHPSYLRVKKMCENLKTGLTAR